MNQHAKIKTYYLAIYNYMETLLFIGLLVLGYYAHSRFNKIDERIENLETRSTTMAPKQPIPRAEEGQVEVSGIQTKLYPTKEMLSTGSTPSDRFVDWVKEDFMVKLGALLLILALGWFVSYAILEEWIGPAGQISLGLLIGTVFLMLGVWRIQKFRHQGGIFTVLGATTNLLTIFAAREIYNLFTPISALLVIFMTVVFVAFVSVRYQSERLAFAGLFMASIAPFLTDSLPIIASELFTYLLVVVAGTLWVVWLTG